VTKQLTFDVEVNKTATFTKTEITQNYQNYWQENGYVTTAYEGEVKVLAIPIWFIDSDEFISTDDTVKDSNDKTQREQIIEDLNTALFGENEDLIFHSLRTYYLEESLGRLKISGKVTPWYESNTKSTDYGDKDSAITTLTVDAVKWYFDESGTSETRADYDANNDGKIDHVMVFYGSNYHCFRNGRAVASGWCRKVGDTTDSYISRSSFSWISALDLYGINGLSPNVYSQLTRNDLSTIHGIKARTIIHEFAHAIGILDIYDTSMKNEPAGGFSMQSGKTGGHDPYNMMAMGWANPYVFDSSDTTLSNEISITINDFQSSGDIILLTPDWDNENQIFDEYILLELFTASGLNQFDANAGNVHNLIGIRLWHINATIDSSTNRHYNTNNSLEGNYDLVHFIRNDIECEYRSLTALDTQDYLFDEGDSFDMETYKSQFYNADGKLDNGTSLGWSFEVTGITVDEYGNATATIKLVKTA
jgi:M6 family metalloprotease-like protein